MLHSRYHLPVLAVCAAVLYLFQLGSLHIMPPDEPRYAQVSQEMIASGIYVVPTLNGEAYKEKPPLYFWLSAIGGIPQHHVSEFAARLPSALAAIATVLLTYALARSMFNAELAFLAAFILLSTTRFWWQARVGQLDMLLTALVTGAVYCLWLIYKKNSAELLPAEGALTPPLEKGGRGGFDASLHLPLYTLLALGMLTKGPPALIFPALLVLAFDWRQPTPLRKHLHWPLGLLFIAAVFLLWLIPARMGASHLAHAGGSEAQASGELFKQTVGRFLLGVSKAEMPWYYLINLPKDLLPWSPILLGTLALLWRTRKADPAQRFLWAWFLPAFLFFTISIAKRITYILPLYPALAILIALGAQRGFALLSEAWRFRITLFWGALVLALGLSPWLAFRPHLQAIGLAAAVPWAAITILCGLDALRRAAGRRLGDTTWMLALHTAALLLAAIPLVAAVNNAKFSVRDFCAPVAAATARGEDFDLYSLALFREELRYYSQHPVIEVLMDPLEVEGGQTLSNLKAQVDLRSRLRKIVGALDLKDTAQPNTDDQQKLEAALNAFIADAKHPDETKALLAALKDELDRFVDQFTGARKALCYVEERDWRWLRAVEPRLAQWSVSARRNLPDRSLYLIGNPAAATLLK